MSETNILYQKEGFIFTKKVTNNYNISFTIQNNNIILSKIIDFHLVKLIYDLNPDIYEKINIQPINENEVKINFLMKHLFEDLGLPQRFSYVYMSKVIEENCIQFISQSIKNERPHGMPSDAELLPIQNMNCNCAVVNNHEIQFSCNIIFDNTMVVPPIAEKLVGIIIYKIFNRVKQFIENIRM
jgi:hypothetical protein